MPSLDLTFSLLEEVGKDRFDSINQLFRAYRVELLSLHLWRSWEGWHFPKRRWEHAYLIFPRTGSFEVKVENKKRIIQPGEGVLLSPDLFHEAKGLPGKPIENFVVHFRFLDSNGLILKQFFPKHYFKFENPSYWFETFKYATLLVQKNELLRQDLGERILKPLFAALLAAGETFLLSSIQMDRRLLPALSMIHTEYHQEISVSKLSALAGISEKHFRKLFSRFLGMTPKEYLADYRLNQAAFLLRGSGLKVNEIARKTGFNNDSYFHSRFKKKFKKTTNEYRRSVSSY